MLYITGQHALNLPCSLNTCGDWHASALRWDNLKMADSDRMFFGGYGIEKCSRVPGNPGTYYAANHIRALLDLMEIGNFSIAQGMRDGYVCAPEYTPEIFHKVWDMRMLPKWKDIDAFMEREYRNEWVLFRKEMEQC